jgi:hypothetical protein
MILTLYSRPGYDKLCKIASNSRRAEDLARSTCYQALATDKNLPKNYDTTKLVKKLALTSANSC